MLLYTLCKGRPIPTAMAFFLSCIEWFCATHSTKASNPDPCPFMPTDCWLSQKRLRAAFSSSVLGTNSFLLQSTMRKLLGCVRFKPSPSQPIHNVDRFILWLPEQKIKQFMICLLRGSITVNMFPSSGRLLKQVSKHPQKCTEFAFVKPYFFLSTWMLLLNHPHSLMKLPVAYSRLLLLDLEGGASPSSCNGSPSFSNQRSSMFSNLQENYS